MSKTSQSRLARIGLVQPVLGLVVSGGLAAAMIAGAVVSVQAQPVSLPGDELGKGPCLQQEVRNWSQRENQNCAAYTRCPTEIWCRAGHWTGFNQYGQYEWGYANCEEVIGGSSEGGKCTGGIPTPSSQTVFIRVQPCVTECTWSSYGS